MRHLNFRDRLRIAKSGNDFYADLAGKPRLEYPELSGQKRASPVRNPDRISEAQVNEMIRSEMAARQDLVLWRNNRGMVHGANGVPIIYGVGPNGASDWIGYKVVEITPEMVGRKIAQFVAVEAKAPDASDPTDAQQRFLDRVNYSGGSARVVYRKDHMETL